MFVSTMFVILCVSLYLRDGGMHLRFIMNRPVRTPACCKPHRAGYEPKH